MSIAATKATRTVHRNEDYVNNGKLLQRLGGIPAERVRLWPPPGTATFADLEDNNDGDPTAHICELIEGTLVEKPMGLAESEAAQVIGFHLMLWNQEAKLGFFAGEGGVVRLAPKTGQAPRSRVLSLRSISRKETTTGAHPDHVS